MKKNRAFILLVTGVSLLIVSGVFYLLALSLKNKIDFNTLDSREQIKKLDLANSYTTAPYEFYLIDRYIVNAVISSKEEYILNLPSGEKIWSSDAARNSKSFGGFSFSTIEPNPNTLPFSGNYKFTFELSKEIILLDEKQNPFLKVYLYTNPFYINCYLDKKTDSLTCEDSNINFSNFKCLGEVLNNDVYKQ